MPDFNQNLFSISFSGVRGFLAVWLSAQWQFLLFWTVGIDKIKLAEEISNIEQRILNIECQILPLRLRSGLKDICAHNDGEGCAANIIFLAKFLNSANWGKLR